MSEASDGRMEEYRHLYQEIGRNSQISQNVFLGNVAVTAGLIGYGLQSGFAPIFLAPFAIIVPSLFFLASQLESTTRIAAYLAVYFEEDSADLNWESRWLALRRDSLMPTKRKYTLSLSGLYGLLSLMCLLLALQYWSESAWSFLITVTPIVVLVTHGVNLIVQSFSLQLVDAYMTSWRILKSRETEPGDAP